MSHDKPFMLASDDDIAARKRDQQFRYGENENIICVTDSRGTPKNEWRANRELIKAVHDLTGDLRTEIVVDATDGFIPLWARNSTLRWTFDEVSMQAFDDPEEAKAGVEALFEEALGRWGDACPLKFARDDNLYDFKIVMRSQSRCSVNGCVLASSFFPDGGQHEFVMYPTLFEQSREEQLETFIHELGHVFGLRHFFALISETAWPAIIYGEHKKFSIMNYGSDSQLTDADKSDLRSLYENVWSGKIVALNGTPVKLMQPRSAEVLQPQ